jgi:hypothetical protein
MPVRTIENYAKRQFIQDDKHNGTPRLEQVPTENNDVAVDHRHAEALFLCRLGVEVGEAG